MVDFDPNPWVRGFEKLLDYTASGVGAIAGPMLAPWQARREADALRITAGGEADALRIIAAAQAEARETLVSATSSIQGEIDIAETVSQRIQFQEEKRHRNIGSVIRQTAQLLGDNEVPGQEPDHDWTARFFNYIQDISSEEMQLLWAKVLAGQIERPGSVSIKALSILRNLDQTVAQLFQTLCACCVTIKLDENAVLMMMPSLDGRADANSLHQFGFDYANLNILNENGLIISNYGSGIIIQPSGIAISADPQIPPYEVGTSFIFQGRLWRLIRSRQTRHPAEPPPDELRVTGVALTNAAKDLSSIVGFKPMPAYHQALTDFFASKDFAMAEIKPPPHA